MEFDTVPERNRIDDKMGVIMAGITVSSHYHFKTVAPKLLGQLYADLMGNLRCDFIGLKGLIN